MDFSKKCTKGYRFGFNGQEKDDEIAGQGNMMTAEYWEYDSRLGRRWNCDPKHYAYESPYSVMGDNPITRTDVLGDKWKDGEKGKDAQKANDLTRKLEKREKQLLKLAEKNEKAANRAERKGKIADAQANRELAQIRREGAADLRKQQAEIKEMGETEKETFSFEKIPEGVAGTYRGADGVIYMQYTDDANGDAISIHELTHGYGQLSGRSNFVIGGDEFGDIHDEVDAYKRQFHFAPETVSTIDLRGNQKLGDGTSLGTFKRLNAENIKNISVTDKNGIMSYPYQLNPNIHRSVPGSPAAERYKNPE